MPGKTHGCAEPRLAIAGERVESAITHCTANTTGTSQLAPAVSRDDRRFFIASAWRSRACGHAQDNLEWETAAGYLRLCTHPSVVGEPVSMDGALDALRAIRATPGHTFLPDNSTLAEPAISLERVTTWRHVTDTHLVNLAAVSGAVLATLDRGIEQITMPEDRRHVLVLP